MGLVQCLHTCIPLSIIDLKLFNFRFINHLGLRAFHFHNNHLNIDIAIGELWP